MGEYYGNKKIIEYTGRICDARKELGCTCGESKQLCEAQEHIINVKTNWYQYKSSLPQKEVVIPEREKTMVTYSTDQQLKKLREQWRQAKQSGDIERMKWTEKMAHRLKNPPEAYFSHQVKQSLGIHDQSVTNNK